ncbi:MAG: glycosyltransferase family 2 protein, partial [Proteobacteria bacterium]
MQIAVVIPAYKVKEFILDVISQVPENVAAIYVVDDACPQQSGKLVQEKCADPRVRVIHQEKNSGVGGATIRGIQHAFEEGNEIVVKIDGDGQMDPKLLPKFVKPILDGKADYSKGNRFHSPANLRSMPGTRLFGNAVLSFFSKATTGYWNIMDPTNGYFALHTSLVPALELDKLAPRYFFENDMLFR